MAAENSPLKAQVSGLKIAVSIEQKRRRRGKPVISNISTLDSGKATSRSPAEIQLTKQLLDDQAQVKEQDAVRRPSKSFKSGYKRRRTPRWFSKGGRLWRPERQEKEEATQQRLANLQLERDMQQQNQNQDAQCKASKVKEKVVIMESDIEAEVPILDEPRPWRNIKPPRRFQE